MVEPDSHPELTFLLPFPTGCVGDGGSDLEHLGQLGYLWWEVGVDRGDAYLAWSDVTGKPTTVSGFGITDAMTTAHAAEIQKMSVFIDACRDWSNQNEPKLADLVQIEP